MLRYGTGTFDCARARGSVPAALKAPDHVTAFFRCGGAWRVLPALFFFKGLRSVFLFVWLCGCACRANLGRLARSQKCDHKRPCARSHNNNILLFTGPLVFCRGRLPPSTRSTSQTVPSASFMCQPTRLGPLSSFFDKLHVVPRQLASHGRTNNEVSVVPHQPLQQ